MRKLGALPLAVLVAGQRQAWISVPGRPVGLGANLIRAVHVLVPRLASQAPDPGDL